MADEIEKICPICGKRFGVLHPDLWVYKKQKDGRTIFFCRYTCYRTDEKKEKEMNKAEMDKRDLILTVLDNVEVGHSAAETLRDAGYVNGRLGWGCLRKWARQNAPDLVARMEKVLIEPTKKAEVSKVETVPPVEKQNAEPLKLQGGVNYELKVNEEAGKSIEDATSAIQRLTSSLKALGDNLKKPKFRVIAVETSLGNFSVVDSAAGAIQWDSDEQHDYIILSREKWMELAGIIPELLKILEAEGK